MNNRTGTATFPPSLSTDGLGAWYAIACGLVRNTGTQNTNSLTLHTCFAESEEEAKGSAIIEALKVKPGFAVWEVICLKLPEAPNAELTGGGANE